LQAKTDRKLQLNHENMGVVIGIDVGGSTTKIVGVENKTIKSPMFVKATDPVTSLFGAFGKYIYDNGITLPEIEMVMLTGVTSHYTACRQPRQMNSLPMASVPNMPLRWSA
jgi:type II pantothenate kinase